MKSLPLLPNLTEQDSAQRQRTLNAFLLGTLATVALLAAFTLPTSQVPGQALAVYLTMAVGLLATFWVARRGRLGLASVLYLGLVWGSLSYVGIILHARLDSPALWANLLLISAAGLLLDGRMAFLFAGLSSAVSLWLHLVRQVPAGAPPLVAFPPKYSLTFLLAFYFCAALLVHITARDLRSALRRARQHEQDLAERNALLEEARATLEVKVEGRTAEFQRQKEYYAALVRHSPAAIVSLDMNHHIVACNPAFEALFGYSEAEVIGFDLDNLITEEASREEATSYTSQVLQGQTIHKLVRRRRKDGNQVDLEVSAVPVLVEGQQVGVLGIYQDITERLESEERLTHMATHDPLTGLPNRTLFYLRLDQALLRARRNNNTLAVFFLDLDGLKAVNDTFGHAKGDILLQHVAERLSQPLRKSDLVARLGGDEFAFILEDLRGPLDAALIAHKVHAALAEPFSLEGATLSITASLGISLYPQHAEEARDLLNLADGAMYQIKSRGKNGYAFSK